MRASSRRINALPRFVLGEHSAKNRACIGNGIVFSNVSTTRGAVRSPCCRKSSVGLNSVNPGVALFFVALATDYDGTLAHHGEVSSSTLNALCKLKESGRKAILVTGRTLDDLQRAFGRLDLFDMVVCENGALLFDAAEWREIPLAEPAPAVLVERLRSLGVAPLSVGHTVVATREPNETAVLEAIRELGLEQHIIFNKGAVMVLPSDVNKASGLKHALARLSLSPHNVVGIGDAENDQAFLNMCGCAVAVGNALDPVKSKADLVVADDGAGVAELIGLLVENDLSRVATRVAGIQPMLGERADKTRLRLAPRETVLITGRSGGGKSTIVTALLEQMAESALQFCVIDAEGDYAELRDSVIVGDARQEPRLAIVMELLSVPGTNAVVNLTAIDPDERPRFIAEFLPELAKLRAQTGRPHWIVIDEAHHFLPANWEAAPTPLPKELPAAIAVTVHADQLARDFLDLVSTVAGVGERADDAIEKFRRATCRQAAARPGRKPGPDDIQVMRDNCIEIVTGAKPGRKQQRHVRKYAAGDLGEDNSFYFCGPDGALHLRAQNLAIFLQMAAGVDDPTWLFHLQKGDYSAWFRDVIKDDALADEARRVERDASLPAAESRGRIAAAVTARYTVPAEKRKSLKK